MSTVDAPRMTVEEFLALPDDGVERMLIDGAVRELGMTVRRWRHAAVQVNVAHLLREWVRGRPLPRGRVVGGEAGFRLSSGTLVGIDVAYASPELAAATPEAQAYFDGSPTLAVEVLSPSDKQEDIDDKITAYLDADVQLIWIVHSRFRTVTVYRPGEVPSLYNIRDEIDAEPHLPGFRVSVAEFFED